MNEIPNSIGNFLANLARGIIHYGPWGDGNYRPIESDIAAGENTYSPIDGPVYGPFLPGGNRSDDMLGVGIAVLIIITIIQLFRR